MTTATKITESLAEALGRTHSSVESYGLVLRRFGWWQAAKRGRGARPLTSMEAAKLLLAVMSEGPADLAGPEGSGFFLRYANLALLPNLRDDPIVSAVREMMGLKRNAEFLDYLDGLVRLFRDGQATDLIFHSPDPEGFADDWVWEGPSVDIRVAGPFPTASITFLLSHDLIDRLVASGHSRDDLLGPKTLAFVDQLFGWRADVAEKHGPDAEAELAGFDNAISGLREQYNRGVRFERAIGGREVDAVASILEKSEADE